MSTLQEKITYAATVHTAQLATSLVETGSGLSIAMMMHDDGYRVIEGSEKGFLELIRGYVTRYQPRAYALILDASYQSDQREETPCILCVTVRDDGKARTLQTPYTRSGGKVELQDEVLVPLDEPFMRFYEEPLDFTHYSPALSQAVDLVAHRQLQSYLGFFVIKS